MISEGLATGKPTHGGRVAQASDVDSRRAFPRAPSPAFPLSHYLCLSPSLTGLSRTVYYFIDDLSAASRRVATVCNAGPSRPAHSILLTSPPNPMAPEPLSTPPLDPRLMDRWLATKMIEILVTARKERDESYTVNESLLVESDSPERSKEILR